MALAFCLVGLLLVGCGAPPTPAPTATSLPPSATPQPTDTPAPTDTPLPPPSTSTPTPLPPTATATLPATDTPAPTATTQTLATAAPAGQVVAPPPSVPVALPAVPALPANVCPLTGLVVSDPSVLERRPLAVKVSNAPSVVRPQAGLDKADVVFEHLAEAKLTRFTAIFLSQNAAKIGSVRSARLIDLEIPAMFKSMLAFSGASAGVREKLKTSDIVNQVISPDPGFRNAGFRREPAPGKAVEHTMFTDTGILWQITAERGMNQRQDLTGWAFDANPPAGGQPGSSLDVVYSPRTTSAEWRYDAGRDAYLRYVLGAPHTEELSGAQLSAKNVIVLYANHVETDIVEDSTGSKPYYSIQAQIWGQGPAKIFRNGRMYDVTWVRPDRGTLLRFVDANGAAFPFNPGNTWIQVVPLDFTIKAG